MRLKIFVAVGGIGPRPHRYAKRCGRGPADVVKDHWSRGRGTNATQAIASHFASATGRTRRGEVAFGVRRLFAALESGYG